MRRNIGANTDDQESLYNPNSFVHSYVCLYVLQNLYECLYVLRNTHVRLYVLRNSHVRLYMCLFVLPKSYKRSYVLSNLYGRLYLLPNLYVKKERKKEENRSTMPLYHTPRTPSALTLVTQSRLAVE